MAMYTGVRDMVGSLRVGILKLTKSIFKFWRNLLNIISFANRRILVSIAAIQNIVNYLLKILSDRERRNVWAKVSQATTSNIFLP